MWGVPVVTFDSSNPPPDWPDDLPVSLLDDELAGIKALGTAMNLGEIDNRGVELGVAVQLGQPWTVFANYSWQDDPITENLPTATLPTGQEWLQFHPP